MTVERTKDEVIVRLSPNIDAEDLQGFLDYARYKELTAGIDVPQDEIDKLASDVNKSWWEENKDRFHK